VIFVAGCVAPHETKARNFQQQLVNARQVKLTGWLTTLGEFKLFSSKNAMRRKAKYPECISGVMANEPSSSFKKLNGRHVRVTATVWKFNSLPKESDYELARRVLSNSIITNWCFGDDVLLIERIEEL
jgi:hypothetical protein